MYETWADLKIKYPNKWIVLTNAKFENPKYLMGLLGGEVFSVTDDQEEMCNSIPLDFEYDTVCKHTNEEAAVGILYAGF